MRSLLVLFAAVAVFNANTRLRDESVPKKKIKSHDSRSGIHTVSYRIDGISASVHAEQNQTD